MRFLCLCELLLFFDLAVLVFALQSFVFEEVAILLLLWKVGFVERDNAGLALKRVLSLLGV